MVFSALTRVFRRPAYIAIATLTSLLAFVLAVWLPNLALISSVLVSDAPPSIKIGLPVSLLGSISSNFTLVSAAYTIMIALLFGMNLAMTTFFFRRRITDMKQSGMATGVLGITSGILGLGCAACGTFVFATLFAWLGAGVFIRSLPLAGGEFGIIGVVLLFASLYMAAKQIEDPKICNINY